MNEQFAQEVMNGLRATPKRLPSKYFYDKEGDRLFQEIMKLDEYYLTSCEYEILDSNKEKLRSLFTEDERTFNLIELGAGDGFKTELLIEHFLEKKTDFKYVPIDISSNVLNILGEKLRTKYPTLKFKGIRNDYFKALNELENGGVRNIILFLGSNIGNFTKQGAVDFLRHIRRTIKTDDMVLIGFDLKKNPSSILGAYNDQEGVTRQFNMNLLSRINSELNGNFKLENFLHYPVYNPETGLTASYLVSTVEQDIEILDSSIHLERWETIHTEVSQKYSMPEIQKIAEDSNFKLCTSFFDRRHYFTDTLWKK